MLTLFRIVKFYFLAFTFMHFSFCVKYKKTSFSLKHFFLQSHWLNNSFCRKCVSKCGDINVFPLFSLKYDFDLILLRVAANKMYRQKTFKTKLICNGKQLDISKKHVFVGVARENYPCPRSISAAL